MYKLIFSCTFCQQPVKSTKEIVSFPSSRMQKPLQGHWGASGKYWTIALWFEFCTENSDNLVLPWGIPSALSQLFYLNSPITPFTGKTNLLKGFSSENTQWKSLFPADRQLTIGLWSDSVVGQKLKAEQIFCNQRNKSLFWLCMNSGHSLVILSVLRNPDSPVLQQMFCTASCDFQIETYWNNLNTADGHFNFYIFSYTGFWTQYPLQIVTFKKNSILDRDICLVLSRLFFRVIL